MKLGWYLHRLRNMGPAEILNRLQEKACKLQSLHQHQGWELYSPCRYHPVLPHLHAAMRSASLEQRQAVSAAADMILSGHFSALGRDWPDRHADKLFTPNLWRLDPVTGGTWPGAQTYCFDIDFRHDGTLGDVKYVWEINRLQFLPVLAAYWLQSGNKQALAAIESAIESWHRANPPFGGVAWASGIEVAIRTINIIVTLDLAGQDLSTSTRQLAGQILTASAFWLSRFPSLFSSANNHRVAELAGEYLLARAAGRLGTPAKRDLLKELDKQILPDGSGAEQTPTYAAFTAELLLLCAQASSQSGEPFPDGANQRLAAFANFVAWLGPIRFGDDDEGRVLSLGPEDDYASSIAAAINGFLNRPGLPTPADDFRAIVYGFPPSTIRRPNGLKTFDRGGISLWRGTLANRTVDLSFDHGPLGYLSIAAHGHADALSITLALDDRPILVDPGTWLYGSGGVWRDWFRSTSAHNTLNVAGTSQSQIAGAFNWSHKAKATLLNSALEPDWILEAEHDGYDKRFGVRHRRRLHQDGTIIVITDQLLGGNRQAELVFQLAADLEVFIQSNVATILRDGVPEMDIAFPSAAIAVASGGEDPGQGGWVSPVFGKRYSAPRLTWNGSVGVEGVVTRLCPAPYFVH